MNDQSKTKEQLIDELNKLRQRNIELELAQKNQDYSYTTSVLSSPSHGFSTGRSELFISNNQEHQADNRPLKYKFTDLVDVPFLQQLLHSFYVATGIPHGLHDENNNILSGKGWQDICAQFHRVCPQTECRCKQSDSYIFDHLNEGSYIGYKCVNGLMDFGTPIIIEGQHLASIFLGQFLHELPDEEFFRRQAQEFGFDEAAYMDALRRVPIIPEDRVESIMKFYSELGRFLATIGLERKRQLELADQTVKDYEERIKLIFETSNEGFWDWNMETGDIYVNRRWNELIELYGYPPDLEFNINTWMEMVHPDDIIHIKKTFAEHLAGRISKYETEYRLLTKSGDCKWIMMCGQVVARNEKGEGLRMVGTSLDITARKKTEAALVLSEEKFFKAFHCNPDLMSISTLKEGRYVEVNDAFVEISGYERNEVIGRTNEELDIWVVPEQRDIIIKQVRENRSIGNIETMYRIKSGEIRTFNMSVDIIDIDGEAHLIISTRDVTERKQIEESLRLSEECLFKAFNTSPVVMTITTLEEGKFIRVNNAFCRIVGYSHEEVIGKTSLEVRFWSDHVDRNIVKQMLMAKQSIQDMEINFCKHGKEQRLGLYSAEGIEIHGELCILSVLTDITDLRQMEVEMTRLDRLNLVGEMAASIGHEIRNPMTTVRGYLQILRENKHYSQELEYFDLMIEELDRANSIITEFLSLAKNKIVDMKPRNINAIISKLLPLIQAKAMGKDQYIKLELNELPDLLLDKKEIRQLILNLVNNGMESMSSAGEITIKTFIEKEKVVFAVQDQGHGIDLEHMDRLGTPFFTTKEQGTGLGLAVCYRIATRHNARIDIDTSSTGTTFYVSFPIPIVAIKAS